MRPPRSAITLAAAMLLSLTSASWVVQAEESSPDSSTVGLWHLNETGGSFVADASTNANHGTAVNTTIVPGVFGLARHFARPTNVLPPGTAEFVEVPDASSLDITGELTIEAWILPESLLIEEGYVIASKWAYRKSLGSFSCSYLLGVRGSDRRIEFMISYDGTGEPDGRVDLFSTSPLAEDGLWHHVAAVYRPSTSMTIFVDGVLDGELTTGIPNAIFSSNARFIIGAEDSGLYDGVSTLFNGYIDEVRLSNVARESRPTATRQSSWGRLKSLYR